MKVRRFKLFYSFLFLYLIFSLFYNCVELFFCEPNSLSEKREFDVEVDLKFVLFDGIMKSFFSFVKAQKVLLWILNLFFVSCQKCNESCSNNTVEFS